MLQLCNTSRHNLKTHRSVQENLLAQSQTQGYCKTDAMKSGKGRLKALRIVDSMESEKKIC